ncbi:MAG TPA: FecR domain-containing protein [Parasegetibacter sp.]
MYTLYTDRKQTEEVEKEILNRYFNNTASPEERKKVNDWLTDHTKRDEAMSLLQEYWNEGAFETAEVPEFEYILDRAINAEKQEAGVFSIQSAKRFWLSAAAACIVFLALGIWMGYFLTGHTDETNNGTLTSLQTGKGERTRLTLSDGSEVFVNAETKISFPEEVDEHKVVYLEGEAYFNLKDESKPFKIKTRDLVTTTKGSRLNISAFPSDSTVKVQVEKGNAEVSKNQEEFPLIKLTKPKSKEDSQQRTEKNNLPVTAPLIKLRMVVLNERESVTFNKNSGNTDVSLSGVHEMSEWKDGILRFNDANYQEIAEKIERWFGLEVKMPVTSRGYTAEFKNAELDQVLNALSNEFNLEYTIKENIIYLRSR